MITQQNNDSLDEIETQGASYLQGNTSEISTMLKEFGIEVDKKNQNEERNLNITLETSNKKFSLEETVESHRACSFFVFGKPTTSTAPGYSCEKCYPGSFGGICQHCRDNCHNDCLKVGVHISQSRHISYCECGFKNHKVKSEIEGTDSNNKCGLAEDLHLTSLSYCRTCKVYICFSCYGQCHKSHYIVWKVEKTSDTIQMSCECSVKNHKNYSSYLIYYISLVLRNIGSMVKMKQKVLNNLLLSEMDMQAYFTFGKETVLSNYQQVRYKKDIALKFTSFVFDINWIFSRVEKEFFPRQGLYVNPLIRDIFPYDQTCELMKNICNVKQKDLRPYPLGYYLGNVIMNVHFKTDFQFQPYLKMADFCSTSIIWRLIQRKKFMSSLPDELKRKYFTSQNKIQNIIVELCDRYVQIIATGYIFSIAEEVYVIKIFLKAILQGLRFMLFDKTQLELLNYNLYYILNSKVFLSIRKTSHDANLQLMYRQYIKILTMLIVSYNDLVCEEHILANANGTRQFLFDIDAGFWTVKTIFLLCYLKKSFICQGVLKGKKYFDMGIELLKMACLGNNNYFHQIERMNMREVNQFLAIESTSQKTEDNSCYFIFLADRINKKLEEFFIPKKLNLYDNPVKYIFHFKELLNEGRLQDCFKSSSDIFTKEQKYHMAVINLIEQFTSMKINQHIFDCSLELQNSNLDLVLSNFLRLNFMKYEQQDLDVVMALLSLYLLSKETFIHLLIGNKIKLIFLQFYSRALDTSGMSSATYDQVDEFSFREEEKFIHNPLRMKFLFLLFKGMDIYSLEHFKEHYVSKISKLMNLTFTNVECKIFVVKLFKIFASKFEAKELEKVKNISMVMFNEFISNKNKVAEVLEFLSTKSHKEIRNIKPEEKDGIDVINDPENEELISSARKSNFHKFVEENEKTYLILQDNHHIPHSEKSQDGDTIFADKKNDKSIFFSLFNLLSYNMYITFENTKTGRENLTKIQTFFHLDYLRKIFQTTYIPLKERANMLKLITAFFFVESAHNFTFKKHEYLTDNLMMNMWKSQNFDVVELQIMLDMHHIIEIIIKDLDIIEDIIMRETDKSTYFNYAKEILFVIKKISDFLLNQNEIWSRITFDIFKLTRRLISKYEIFHQIFAKKEKISFITKNEEPVLDDTSFNVANYKNIYKILNEYLFKLFEVSDIYGDFSLSSFLEASDIFTNFDYNSAGLQHYETQFEVFYSLESSRNRNNNALLITLKSSYLEKYRNFAKSSFMRVFNSNSVGELIPVKRIVSDLFFEYFSSCGTFKYQSGKNSFTLLSIIDKMLYSAAKKTQETLTYLKVDKKTEEKDKDKPAENVIPIPIGQLIKKKYKEIQSKIFSGSDKREKFFLNLYELLNQNFQHIFFASTNFLHTKRLFELTQLNISLVNFLTFLTECYNKEYLPTIFEIELSTSQSISFFNLLQSYYLKILEFIQISDCLRNNLDLNTNKLLVILSTLTKFFVQITEIINPNEDKGMTAKFENFFQLFILKTRNLMYFKIWENEIPVEKMNKNTLHTLLHIKTQVIDLLNEFLMKKEFNPSVRSKLLTEMPNDTLYYVQLDTFALLLHKLENDKRLSSLISRIDFLTEKDFGTVLTSMWIHQEAQFHSSIEFNFCMKFSIYNKLWKVLYFNHILSNFFIQSRDISKAKPVSDRSQLLLKRRTFPNEFSSNLYHFFDKLVLQIDIKKDFESDDKKLNKKIVIFLRPHITYYLSNDTKKRFMENVNRESRMTKLTSLIKEFDYFLYEMVYNASLSSAIRRISTKIEIIYCEEINYIFIVIHQIILLTFYYSNGADSVINKYEISSGNYSLGIIQLIYLGLVILIWFTVRFHLSLQHDLMKAETTRFFFQNVKQAKLEEKSDLGLLIKSTASRTKFFTKLKVGLLETIIFNNDINILIVSFIFTLIFLLIKNAICLAFQVLFIAKLINILSGIFIALKLKWKQLTLLLIYTYLLIYLFSWISFYFLDQLFIWDNTYDSRSMGVITENHCQSAIQCYFTLVDMGFRNGGGIGDQFPPVSWTTSASFFMGKFFYNISFHICIILIMGNIFFGIIVDAFSELRDQTNHNEEDKTNCCFICGLTREEGANKQIDFDMHRGEKHDPWKYIYFLTYMHLSNPYDFSEEEYNTYIKLQTGHSDISWIPEE